MAAGEVRNLAQRCTIYSVINALLYWCTVCKVDPKMLLGGLRMNNG